MANTITLTDPETIISDVSAAIDALNNSLLDLNSSCITYNDEYKTYLTNTQRDGTLLKDRMKEAVAKAVGNELQ